MYRQKPAIAPGARHTHLWLAAVHGVRLVHSDEMIAASGEPETVLEVEFEGLTEDEQRRALSGFPGGRRFRLAASSRH